MRFRLRFFVFGFLSLALSLSGSAQQAPPVGRRVTPLTVLDRNGQPIKGLTTGQLRVRGVKADWTLNPTTRPRRVLLVADAHAGGSDLNGRWLRSKKFLREFLLAAAGHLEFAYPRLLVPLSAPADK